jgi:eukaryotic translation initiation factor 2C
VVASIDNRFAQYLTSMEIQESKKEVCALSGHSSCGWRSLIDQLIKMITNLAGMMHERLETFRSRNKGILPQRVLVYRDGVSEVSGCITGLYF